MDKGNLDQRQQAIMDRLEHEMAEDASNIAACDGAAKLGYFRTSPGALISWLAATLRGDLPRSFEAARGTFHLSTLPLGSIRSVDEYTQVLTMTGNYEYPTDDPGTSRMTWPQGAIIFSARDVGSDREPLVELTAQCRQQIVIPYLDYVWAKIERVYKPESVPDTAKGEATANESIIADVNPEQGEQISDLRFALIYEDKIKAAIMRGELSAREQDLLAGLRQCYARSAYKSFLESAEDTGEAESSLRKAQLNFENRGFLKRKPRRQLRL